MPPALIFFNTLTRKLERFEPLVRGIVNLYTCGPTVYDYAHLGNWRTFIFEDVLRRTLKYFGFRVNQVMNLTDIDDKIIKRAQDQNQEVKAIADLYTNAFFADLAKLNIERAERYPEATAHLPEMIKLVERLMAKGAAYRGEDGSVYFSIKQFKNYGRLSGLEQRDLKTGTRLDVDEYTKEEARDFVLWKAAKAGEPSWPSPWGRGRPGWHLECSAMSMKYLGEQIDFHCGGVDLIFPHHENEIAQSEAATGRKFVNFWLHSGHVLVNNQKMSKSLDNFFTLNDLEKKGFEPLAFRYLVLQTHYRKPLNFTWQALEAAQNRLRGLRERIASLPNGDTVPAKLKSAFLVSLGEDLNTAQALAIIPAALEKRSESILPAEEKAAWLEFDRVLGLDLGKLEPLKIPELVGQLLREREVARRQKDFVRADALRLRIESLGYEIRDTAVGPRVNKR